VRKPAILVRELVRTDRLSTVSMVATDDDGQSGYSFHGEGAADRSLALADLPTKLPPVVRAPTFGSYTMAVEPVSSAFAAPTCRLWPMSKRASPRPTRPPRFPRST
jgi:fructokinase